MLTAGEGHAGRWLVAVSQAALSQCNAPPWVSSWPHCTGGSRSCRIRNDRDALLTAGG
jgi:hypothetical protein